MLLKAIRGEEMQNKNYSKELENIICKLENNIDKSKQPTLLLHSCCAPCSSYVIEYLNAHFNILLLFYNPNIAPYDEYTKRKDELIRLINEMPMDNTPFIIDCDYEGEQFVEMSNGFENEPEGGARCEKCYELRLRKTALEAKKNNCDYFTTTLSISPMKSSFKLNEIGERLALEYGVKHLPSDFKKKEGYKRSIELSRKYNLYRQDYCGCIYSKQQREQSREEEKND